MLHYKETKIRELSESDLDSIMGWVNDPEVVGRYAYFKEPITRDQEACWLEAKVNSKTDFFYAIENAASEYVGNVAVEQIHWPSKNGRLSLTIGNKNERKMDMQVEQLTFFLTEPLMNMIFIKYTW